MPASSVEAISRDEASSHDKTPLLDSRRLAELVGFLLSVAGLLTALSLISYLPRDPSFHSNGPAGVAIHNSIGLVGAYGADLRFQGSGWVAGLRPLAGRSRADSTTWAQVRIRFSPATNPVPMMLFLSSRMATTLF